MGVSEVDKSSLLLDEKLLLFMEQLELLEEKRAKLNSLIEQGWFSISKARYSMGNKQVSSLQYASEIEPLVCVSARKQDNGEVQFCTEKPTPNRNEESGKDQVPVEDIGPQERGVRRRNKPKKDVAEEEKTKTAIEDKLPEVTPVRKNEQNPRQDPLKWFGILVPQTLKQAQSSFKEVIELSAEIATLQTAVVKTRQELKLGLENQKSLAEKLSSPGGQSTLTNSKESEREEDEETPPTTEAQ